MQLKDKVFILKKTRYGDTDLILNCLSSTGARLSLFARSALKSKKRFGGGVLEPTHYVHVMYEERASGGESGLHTLKEASLIKDFPGLRTDYGRIELALHMVRLVGDVVKEGDIGSPDLFNLLGNALRAAEVSTDLGRLRVHFDAKLLANQGMLPLDSRVDEELMRAPIGEHATLPLSASEWLDARARMRHLLQDYLQDSKHTVLPS